MANILGKLSDIAAKIPTKEEKLVGQGGKTWSAPDLGAMFAGTGVGKKSIALNKALTQKFGKAWDVAKATGKFGADIATYLPATVLGAAKNYAELVGRNAQNPSRNIITNVKRQAELGAAALPAGVAIVGSGIANKAGNAILKKTSMKSFPAAASVLRNLEKVGVSNDKAFKIAQALERTMTGSNAAGRIGLGALKGGIAGGMIGGTGEGSQSVIENEPVQTAMKKTIAGVLKGGAGGALMGGAFAGAGEIGKAIKKSMPTKPDKVLEALHQKQYDEMAKSLDQTALDKRTQALKIMAQSRELGGAEKDRAMAEAAKLAPDLFAGKSLPEQIKMVSPNKKEAWTNITQKDLDKLTPEGVKQFYELARVTGGDMASAYNATIELEGMAKKSTPKGKSLEKQIEMVGSIPVQVGGELSPSEKAYVQARDAGKSHMEAKAIAKQASDVGTVPQGKLTPQGTNKYTQEYEGGPIKTVSPMEEYQNPDMSKTAHYQINNGGVSQLVGNYREKSIGAMDDVLEKVKNGPDSPDKGKAIKVVTDIVNYLKNHRLSVTKGDIIPESGYSTNGRPYKSTLNTLERLDDSYYSVGDYVEKVLGTKPIEDVGIFGQIRQNAGKNKSFPKGNQGGFIDFNAPIGPDEVPPEIAARKVKLEALKKSGAAPTLNKPMWDWLDKQEGKPAGVSFANMLKERKAQAGFAKLFGEVGTKKPAYPSVTKLMQFEDGTLSEKDTIKLFQDLVDSGMAWQLQGSYGRQAKAMIDAGVIKLPQTNTTDAYGNKVPSQAEYETGKGAAATSKLNKTQAGSIQLPQGAGRAIADVAGIAGLPVAAAGAMKVGKAIGKKSQEVAGALQRRLK